MLDLYDHEVVVVEPAGAGGQGSFIEAGIS
jgi:hypothetical protein